MVELSVCIGSACHIKGAYNVIQTFQQMIEENALHDRIVLKSAFCMRQCRGAGVEVSVDGQRYNLPAGAAREFFKSTVMPLAR